MLKNGVKRGSKNYTLMASHGWSWTFFCQFPNPWALGVSGKGCYTSKCDKSLNHYTLLYASLAAVMMRERILPRRGIRATPAQTGPPGRPGSKAPSWLTRGNTPTSICVDSKRLLDSQATVTCSWEAGGGNTATSAALGATAGGETSGASRPLPVLKVTWSSVFPSGTIRPDWISLRVVSWDVFDFLILILKIWVQSSEPLHTKMNLT
jgi:hypothetical protein